MIMMVIVKWRRKRMRRRKMRKMRKTRRWAAVIILTGIVSTSASNPLPALSASLSINFSCCAASRKLRLVKFRATRRQKKEENN